MKCYLLTLLVFLFMGTYVSAQVKTRTRKSDQNIEQFIRVKKAPKIIKMRKVNLASKQNQDDSSTRADGVPFKFGEAIDVNITLNNSGEWENTPEGRVWSLAIQSDSAYSINFRFSQLFLGEGSELIIYNESREMLYGPITFENNSRSGRFLTDLIQGDKVILELFEPNGVKGRSKLKIERVVHGYENMFAEAFGDSGDCNVDIECPLGDGWEEESDGVGMVLLASGVEWCSGSLINTTCNTSEPYFLTAFHCIDDNISGNITAAEIDDAEDWLFRFQYKATTCDGSFVGSTTTYNGATLRAAWATTDFALVELNELPTSASLLGWDRSGAIPPEVTIIHHPAGDAMKISHDNGSTTTYRPCFISY